MTGCVLLVFFTPHPSPISWVVIQVQRCTGRKENVSLYICYVTQHDTVISPIGQFFIQKKFKGQGLSLLLKDTLAGWILELGSCGQNTVSLLCYLATQLPHSSPVRVYKATNRICTNPYPPLRMHVHIKASPGNMLYMHLSTLSIFLSHSHTVSVQALQALCCSACKG